MIGSLPHHNIDAALAFSFQMDIPFLPQIPIRNPWEYMIAQALEGMAGLEVEKDGSVSLDLNVWQGRSHALNERLLAAFSTMSVRPDAFESFEPSAATSSGWQPFLWELSERGAKLAKIQIAGPLTAQWALAAKDGSSISRNNEVTSQIYKLVLARALAMCRRLQRGGIQPVLYLDEPALYGFSAADGRNALALHELKIIVQALRKEGVIVGLHCCSDTDWSAVLALDLNLLSIDAGLSLKSLLQYNVPLDHFLRAGGKLSLGVIPTTRSIENPLRKTDPKAIHAEVLDSLESAFALWPGRAKEILRDSLYTPACGLALLSTSDAENVLAALVDFGQYARH